MLLSLSPEADILQTHGRELISARLPTMGIDPSFRNSLVQASGSKFAALFFRALAGSDGRLLPPQVSALLATWFAGALALFYIVRILTRMVRLISQFPLQATPGCPGAHTSHRLQVASGGRRRFFHISWTSARERTKLFVDSPHDWCAVFASGRTRMDLSSRNFPPRQDSAQTEP